MNKLINQLKKKKEEKENIHKGSTKWPPLETEVRSSKSFLLKNSIQESAELYLFYIEIW